MSRKTRAQRVSNNSKPCGAKSPVEQSSFVREAINWFIDSVDFTQLAVHKNTTWSFSGLVVLAVTAAWVNAPGLVQAFDRAKEYVRGFHGSVAICTYQGMMRAISTHRVSLMEILWSRIQLLMAKTSGSDFRIFGFVPIGVDGSRFTTPRTLSNELRFAKPKTKKGGKRKPVAKRQKVALLDVPTKRVCDAGPPQIWVTMFWHLTLQISWRWSQGPSYADERQHCKDTLGTTVFPEKTLFVADAGFVGFELWKLFLDHGHDFVVRVGANVTLLKQLHSKIGEDLVCLWPKEASKRGLAPIILRLVELRTERGRIFLVTSVLKSKVLSDAQLAKLYRLRWGIEVHFRAIKQTYGRRTLRSRNAEHAMSELDIAMVSLAIVQLFALRERVKLLEPPSSTSVAKAISAIREVIEKWHEKVPRELTLSSRLAAAVKDCYRSERPKTARHRPKRDEKPSASKPTVRKANAHERGLYCKLLNAA